MKNTNNNGYDLDIDKIVSKKLATSAQQDEASQVYDQMIINTEIESKKILDKTKGLLRSAEELNNNLKELITEDDKQ